MEHISVVQWLMESEVPFCSIFSEEYGAKNPLIVLYGRQNCYSDELVTHPVFASYYWPLTNFSLLNFQENPFSKKKEGKKKSFFSVFQVWKNMYSFNG